MKINCLTLAAAVLTFASVTFAQSSGIRKVDFKNFNYVNFCIGNHPFLALDAKTVRLRNGHAEQGDSSNFTDLGAVEYVDMNGDGTEEAYVLIKGQTSGSSNGYVAAYVFGYQRDRARPLWSKCEENSESELKGRTIIFTSPEWRKNDAHCCFSYVQTGTYGFKGGKVALLSLTHKKTGDDRPAKVEPTIEELATSLAKAFTSQTLGSLDSGQAHVGPIMVTIEHSLGGRSNKRSFSSFKHLSAWLMRGRREANLVADAVKSCKSGTCTYTDAGMLHNSLYLRRMTYGTAKGRPYIKTVYFVDGD